MRLQLDDHCPLPRRYVSIRRCFLSALYHRSVSTLLPMAPGERSEEAYLWFSTVCEAIQEIPPGKVTSYAHIARLVGKRKQPSVLEHDYLANKAATSAQCPR